MIPLPRYRPSGRDEEEEEELLPLYKTKTGDSDPVPDADSDQAGHTTTTPTPAATLPREMGAVVNGGSTVTYTFEPRYPLTGDRQDAIGVLGRTKAETTEMVQSAFPTLASFPAERIEFFAPVQLDPHNQVMRWGIVMDQAWSTFQSSPPARLKVQVRDAPGDAERRFRMNCGSVVFGLFTFCGFVSFVMFIVWLCGGFGK